MRKRLFINVKSVTGFHIIPVDEIHFISPYHNDYSSIKTTIYLKSDKAELYSTESQTEIFEKLENGKRPKTDREEKGFNG